MMATAPGKGIDGRYASKRRVENLEHDIEALRLAVASQAVMLVDMRSALMPIPAEEMFRSEVEKGASPAVRSAHANL